MTINQLANRYFAIVPRISVAEFLSELAECKIAQRRATIARQKIIPAHLPDLNKWEQLFLAEKQHPEYFPEIHRYKISHRRKETTKQKGAL